MRTDSITLKSTFSASNLLKLSAGDSVLEKIIAVLLRFLEKRFKGELLLETSEMLSKTKPSLWSAIVTSGKIQILWPIVSKKIRPLADEPFLYQYWTKINDQLSGSGSDFISEESALWRSIAEGIERHLWKTSEDFYRKKIIHSTYDKLEGRAINIFSLAGFSEKDRENHEILSFNKNSCLGWTQTCSLLGGKKIYCPTQLLSHHYSKLKVRSLENSQGDEPMLRWSISTGLATGRSAQEAVVKGILEIIERDACMITYLNKLSPAQLDLEHLSEQDEDIGKILKRFRRSHLKVTLLQIPTDFPVFVTMALITDDFGASPALAIGSSADFDVKKCLLDALAESLSIRLALRKNPALFEENFDPKKINRESRLFFWSNPENLSEINFLFQGISTKIELPSKAKLFNLPTEEKVNEMNMYYSEKLRFLKNALDRLGYDGCYIEIAPKEVRKAGLHCAVTVIPELQPMHLDERIPYFSGRRLRETPEKLGYRPVGEINKEPHPFP